MSRLPELDPAKFTPEQKKVHEAVLAGPRGRVVGPIKVWLKNAGLAEHAPALGACDLHHRLVLESKLRVVRARAARHQGRHRSGRDRGDPHRRDAEAYQ